MSSCRSSGHAAAAIAIVVILCATALGVLPRPAAADAGGPDSYGYTWVDSRFPNPGVAFNWIDGISSGTDLGLLDENCTLDRVSFGFPFRFYGSIYTGAYLCPNGLIDFNYPEAQAQFASDYAAALGADLIPYDPEFAPGSGHVYVWQDQLSSPRRFVMTWNAVWVYGTTDPQTFQIVLYENPTGDDGRILFQYKALTNPPPHITGIMNLTKSSSLNYTSPLQSILAVLFLPQGTTPPGDVLTATDGNIAPASVEPGIRDVPMLCVNLTTASNTVYVRSLKVDLSGVPSSAADVSRMSVWRDGDHDGLLNATNDTRLGSAVPSGSPASAVMTFASPMPVAAGQTEGLLVSFDVPLGATVGDWIGARVLAASYIQVATPDTVSTANFPFNSYVSGVRTHVVEGTDTLSVVDSGGRNPPTVSRWQTDVPMLYVTLSADKGAVTIVRLDVTLLSVPLVPGNLRYVKLYLEADGDLELQPLTDVMIGRGTFDVTGVHRFPLNVTVAAPNPVTIWVAFDIDPAARIGDSVGAMIASAASIAVMGTKDVVSPAGFPFSSPTSSLIVGPGPPLIVSRWAFRTPAADGRTYPGEYIVSDANARDLGAIGGNNLSAWLVFENDADFLYVLVDAIGDRTMDANDSAAIAFQTNRTAFPSAPPDDEFGAGGPMGPFHAVLNTTTSMWQVEDGCNTTFDANHSQLACTEGFSLSGFSLAPHRVFEFRIPLALLEVPLPIAPGYTLGVAALSNWSLGVHDAATGGNATWPLPYPPLPPRMYGNLELASAPPVNTPPALNWTGEPGYLADGVNPDAGANSTAFMYRIQFQDADGDFPAFAEPRVHILLAGVEIPGSPFPMAAANNSDTNTTDGKVYVAVRTLSLCPHTYAYYFTAQDDHGLNATPTATMAGPFVSCPPAPPTLRNAIVAPDAGTVYTTNFTWTVEYRDPNGDPPTQVLLSIQKGGTEIANRTMTPANFLGQIGNYSDGRVYEWHQNLTLTGGDYTYETFATDGLFWTGTPLAAGPTVNTEPSDRLVVTLYNNAPPIANQGTRGIKMFTAYLQTSTGFVDVTSFQIDLVGSSTLGDVARITLVYDVNRDGVFTNGTDRVLGQGAFLPNPPQPPRVVFKGFSPVYVRAGIPEWLLAYVDLSRTAVPDDTVALRVLDTTYVRVDPPDVVAPLEPVPTFETDPILINGPPSAVGLTVEGHANHTAKADNLTVGNPAIAWTYNDPNLLDTVQAAYNVSVSTWPAGAPLWYVNQTGSADTATYAGPALVRGGTYRAAVRLFDGKLWGGPSYIWFHRNAPPPPPALASPANGSAGLPPGTVLLRWNASADPEGSVVNYTWYVSTSPSFAGADSGTTFLTSLSYDAAGATTYYWKVKAGDEYEWGDAGAPWSFTTAPAVPTSGSLRGRVIELGHNDTPLIALVQVFNETGVQVNETTTTPSGRFLVGHLPLGTYRIRATATGYLENSTWANLTATNADPDVGDIPLERISEPPPPGPDWAAIAMWTGLGIAIAAIAALAVLVLVRRRRKERAPAREGRGGGAEAPAAEGEAGPAASAAAVMYECPACGTAVTEDAKTCSGCGAIFE